MAAMMVACGGNKEQKNEEFQSPDLSTFFLQGPVKSVTNDDGKTTTFDEQGRVIEAQTGFEYPDGNPFSFKVAYDEVSDGMVVGGDPVRRDSLGRIQWLGWNNNSCSGEEGFHFEYGVEDVIMTSWYDYGECYGSEITEVIKVDDKGNPLQEKSQYGDEEGGEESVIDYEYVTFDNHGNWTERKVKIQTNKYTIAWNEKKGEDITIESPTETTEKTEKRTITYFE